ncbi:MAG: YceI family protein [Candidatus Eremiobacteraeota bacterium]|nr:YceI family protein [Candidatus Eremiobacteraeota bacterium]
MRKAALFTLWSLAWAASASALAAETWTVDPVHSTAQFTARHFGIVPVIGTIPIVKASVQLNSGSQIPVTVSASLDASKLDTRNDMRDSDLRSDHFFNASATPTIEFVSTKIVGTDPAHFTIAGNLTMHGQTHPVSLDARVLASGKSPRGRPIIAYAARGTIDRTQWGMTYGAVVVSNNIDLSIDVEADGPQP